jgi:hypothetical protein
MSAQLKHMPILEEKKGQNIASVKDFIKDMEQLDVKVEHGPETPK